MKLEKELGVKVEILAPTYAIITSSNEENIDNYEKETSRILEVLDKIHDRISVLRKNI